MILKPNRSKTINWLPPCQVGLLFFANLFDSLLEPVSKVDSIGVSCEETKSEKHRGRMTFEFYTTSYGWEQQLYLSACSFIRVATMHSVPKQVLCLRRCIFCQHSNLESSLGSPNWALILFGEVFLASETLKPRKREIVQKRRYWLKFKRTMHLVGPINLLQCSMPSCLVLISFKFRGKNVFLFDLGLIIAWPRHWLTITKDSFGKLRRWLLLHDFTFPAQAPCSPRSSWTLSKTWTPYWVT